MVNVLKKPWSLSADAVPELIALLPSLRPEDPCKVAARVLNKWPISEEPDWRSWSRARAEARLAVIANTEQLACYACQANTR